MPRYHHLIFDIDNTLLSWCMEGKKCACKLETVRTSLSGKKRVVAATSPGAIHAHIRPFARWFLNLAKAHTKTLSLWSNGCPQWVSYVAAGVFPKIDWFLVMDRTHSVDMNKPLTKLFADPTNQMNARNTLLIDDKHIEDFDTNDNPNAHFDSAFLQLAYELGWVTFSAPKTPFNDTRSIKPMEAAFYDPVPFGLANKGAWCYFNAVAQCILRVPTIMRNVKTPIIEWFKLIKKEMGPGMGDSNEALTLLIHPILNTPSQETDDPPPPFKKVSKKVLDEQKKDTSPVCMMYVTTATTTTSAEAFHDYFKWKSIESGDGGDGGDSSSGGGGNAHKMRKVRSVWPGAFITCVVMVVHRNTGMDQGAVNRDHMVVSPCIVTPDKRVFHLRGVVAHRGVAASGGHYASMFVRNNRTVWMANDGHVTECEDWRTTVHGEGQNVSILFYDVCGAFF